MRLNGLGCLDVVLHRKWVIWTHTARAWQDKLPGCHTGVGVFTLSGGPLTQGPSQTESEDLRLKSKVSPTFGFAG